MAILIPAAVGCGPGVADVADDADGGSGEVGDGPEGDDGGPGQEDAAEGDGGDDDDDDDDDDNDDDDDDTTGGVPLCPLPDELLPTYDALQEDVIERTCSVFDNVCHANKEYPDLRGPHGLLDVVGAPCNLEEGPGVTDQCELIPDRLRVTSDAGEHVSDVARFIYDEVDDVMVVELRDAPEFEPGRLATLEVAAPDEPWMLVPTPIVAAAGDLTVQLLYFSTMATEPRSRMEALAAGDPNGNGVWGAETWGYLEITPGDVTSSYLFLAVTGEAPTSQMPLANGPLSDEELVSLACWIEGLVDPGGDSPDAEIDYESCEYAQTQYCD